MEKTKFLLLVLLTAASIIIVSGCSKDSEKSNPLEPGNESEKNQASFTINGDVFDLVEINTGEGAAYYSPEENATYISIVARANTDTLLVLLAVSGKENGLYNWNDTEAISYLIIAGEDGYIPYVSSNSGKTVITQYGNVGGYIKGNFSGSVYESETNSPVDLDGSFVIKRIADQ